jgi:hypothetical protein
VQTSSAIEAPLPRVKPEKRVKTEKKTFESQGWEKKKPPPPMTFPSFYLRLKGKDRRPIIGAFQKRINIANELTGRKLYFI